MSTLDNSVTCDTNDGAGTRWCKPVRQAESEVGLDRENVDKVYLVNP